MHAVGQRSWGKNLNQANGKKRVTAFNLCFPDFSNIKDSVFCSFGYYLLGLSVSVIWILSTWPETGGAY